MFKFRIISLYKSERGVHETKRKVTRLSHFNINTEGQIKKYRPRMNQDKLQCTSVFILKRKDQNIQNL